MAKSVPQYAIGSTVWPGLSKLIEESGELQQRLAQLAAYPLLNHPTLKNQQRRLEEELGDVLATLWFFTSVNALNYKFIERRAKTKFTKFKKWHKG